MAGAPAEEPTTVCQKIYTPINASAAKAKSSRRISRYIKKQIRRNIHSASVTHPRHLLLPYSHFPFFFFSSPPLLPLSPPSSRCCRRFSLLPVVVMPTSQETVLSWIPSGRADQLMSGVVQACAQIAPPVCVPCSQRGSFLIPRGARLPRVLSRLSLSSTR